MATYLNTVNYRVTNIWGVVEVLMVPKSWKFGTVPKPGELTPEQQVVNLYIIIIFSFCYH